MIREESNRLARRVREYAKSEEMPRGSEDPGFLHQRSIQYSCGGKEHPIEYGIAAGLP